MITIPGYSIEQVILTRGNRTSCIATSDADGNQFFLRIVKENKADAPSIKLLRQEFEHFQSLDIEGIPVVSEFVIGNEGAAIVMPIISGELVSKIIPKDGMDIGNFLELAIQFTDIIGQLHHSDVTHTHVSPDIFLMDQKTKNVVLFDLQFARNINKDELPNEVPLNDKHYLRYISPEQTGRIIRKLDYRSDIYSLGVSFYQLLCGHPPFESEDIAGLFHAHLAKSPISPIKLRPEIPEVISSIVLKMLAKSPELRYQSTIGLRNDLAYCLEEWLANQAIADFELGTKDISDIFEIPNKLYGRSKEIGALDKVWESACNGESELMMVAGFSGIGKSALINQLKLRVDGEPGNFMQGKFDQFQRDTPYSAGVEAFRDLIRQILSKPEEEIAYWRKRLTGTLENNAGVIVEALPELELIIGPPPPVLPLSPAETLNRFNLTFLKFFQSFTDQKHPLVLFLDDLQWVDIATLKLIELVMLDSETKNLLLIGAYRDNEVDSAHPLAETIRNLKKQEVSIPEINLGALQFEDLNQLVADTLNEETSKTELLSNLILKKTGGNPFFSTAFLKSLYQEKLISFDYESGKWAWSIDHIRELNITDNVVDLMVKKIKLLDVKTQKLLQLASCIGNNFDLATLSVVYEEAEEFTYFNLKPALLEEMILIEEPVVALDYISQEKDESPKFQFLHDRVQQAAYTLISDESKQDVHLSIARLLLENFSRQEQKIRIFDLVGQFNSGISSITHKSEKLLVSEMNLEAGRKAKLSAAYHPAYKYIEYGISILPESSWDNHYQHTLDIYTEGAEVAYLSSNIEQMEKLTELIFQNAHNDLDKIKAYNIRIQAYVSLAKNEKALNEALSVLKILGVTFPSNPGQLSIIYSLIKTKIQLTGKGIDQLLNLPVMTDPRISAVMETLSFALSPAFFASPNLFPLMVFKQISLSIKYGNHVHTGFAYTAYGLILCGSTNEFDKGQEYGELALQLMYRFDSKEMGAKIRYMRAAFIQHWKEPYENTFKEAIEGYRIGFDVGDFLFGAYSLFHHVHCSQYQGLDLPSLDQLMDNYSSPLKKTKQDLITNWVNLYRQTIANLMNNDAINTDLVGEYFDEFTVKPLMEKGKDFSGLGVFYLEKMMLNYILGLNNKAIEYGIEAEKLLPNLLGTPHPPIIIFYYSLSLLKSVDDNNAINVKNRKSKLKSLFKKLKIWAKSSPENYLHLKLLVEAEINRTRGKKEKAYSTYQESIKTAKKHGAIQVEAIAHELLAHFYLRQGNHANYKKSLLDARITYLNWGAIAKVNQMDQEYEVLSSEKMPQGGELLAGDGRSVSGGQQLDVLSLTKASLAIAGEIHLDRLMSKLMKVVIENAGAQKGFLILQKEDVWVVEAESHVETLGDEVPKSVPIDSHEEIIETIVQYVARTREHLVLEDVQKDSRFSGIELAKKRNIRSVSCLPIINQGRLIAILYFENNLQAGVFTEKRVEFLTILSGQIAISLENALLYQNLEQKVVDRTREIVEEKEKSDRLLLNILPEQSALELKAKGFSQPRSYENASVMFTDFVNFSSICEKLNADELVEVINRYYSFFDSLMEKYGLEKIKTIGDSYMCAGGLPVESTSHASDMVKAALEMQIFIARLKKEQADDDVTFECRIGIHSGPVVAGIVGTKKFAYDIWGDTVNIASRLETNGIKGEVNISEATYHLVKSEYNCEHRGKIKIKNKGVIDMYLVK